MSRSIEAWRTPTRSANRLARRCEQPSFLINLQTSFLLARSSRIYRGFSSVLNIFSSPFVSRLSNEIHLRTCFLGFCEIDRLNGVTRSNFMHPDYITLPTYINVNVYIHVLKRFIDKIAKLQKTTGTLI